MGTKKNILLISLVGSFLVFFLSFVVSLDWCYDNTVCRIFFENYRIRNFLLSLLPFLPLLLLSLLTYKMRDEVFRVWSRFALWFVPLSMLAILLAPEDDGGAWSIPIKGPVALLTSGLFFVISLGLIAWKHFSLKKG